jgi:hypothetical protein
MTNDLARLEALRPRFAGATALVFAPGPSLPDLWRGRESRHPKICVNDAWSDFRHDGLGVIVPGADIVYSSDIRWWDARQGLPDFTGVKVSCRGMKWAAQDPTVIICQVSSHGHTGYDPQLGRLCPGMHSGCAAVHLAAQLGARLIALIGFDFHNRNGAHYFGRYPKAYQADRPEFNYQAGSFIKLAEALWARRVEIVNCTSGSALPQRWFPQVPLDAILERKAA